MSVHGTAWCRPVSRRRCGQLWRMGFQVVEVDLSALGGPEVGIGPRAFAIAWPQCLLDDTLPTYASRRAELYRHLEGLPEALGPRPKIPPPDPAIFPNFPSLIWAFLAPAKTVRPTCHTGFLPTKG